MIFIDKYEVISIDLNYLKIPTGKMLFNIVQYFQKGIIYKTIQQDIGYDMLFRGFIAVD